MIKTTLLLFAVAATAAASTQFSAFLLSPNASAAPGWYDGTGNPNGGFTVDSENGIEIGMRIKLRQDPNVINSPDDTYFVPAGSQIGSPTHAAWNYEFSIDLEPLGVGSLTLGDVSASLTITDLDTLATSTVNPFNYWNDDTGFGSAGKTTPESAAQWGLQQSENPLFADFPLAADYDVNALRRYQFTLTVTKNSDGSVLGTDTIIAQTTPEPSTLLFMGGGLGLILLVRRTITRKGLVNMYRG